VTKTHCDCCDAVITKAVSRESITIGRGYNVLGEFNAHKDSERYDGRRDLCASCTVEALKAMAARVEAGL
jgi:hypothetical protein